MKLDSVVGLVTNSSTSIFTYATKPEAVVDHIKGILDVFGFSSEGHDIKVYAVVDDEFWFSEHLLHIFADFLRFKAADDPKFIQLFTNTEIIRVLNSGDVALIDTLFDDYYDLTDEEVKGLSRYFITHLFDGDETAFENHVAQYMYENRGDACSGSTTYKVLIDGKDVSHLFYLDFYELEAQYC